MAQTKYLDIQNFIFKKKETFTRFSKKKKILKKIKHKL